VSIRVDLSRSIRRIFMKNKNISNFYPKFVAKQILIVFLSLKLFLYDNEL
jgi:hypothetical protein